MMSPGRGVGGPRRESRLFGAGTSRRVVWLRDFAHPASQARPRLGECPHETHRVGSGTGAAGIRGGRRRSLSASGLAGSAESARVGIRGEGRDAGGLSGAVSQELQLLPRPERDVGRALRPVLRAADGAASAHAGTRADAGRPLRRRRRPQDVHVPREPAGEMERRTTRDRRRRALDVRGRDGSEEPDRAPQDRPRTLRTARGARRRHHPLRREGRALGKFPDAGRPASAAQARLRRPGFQPPELRFSRGLGAVPPREAAPGARGDARTAAGLVGGRPAAVPEDRQLRRAAGSGSSRNATTRSRPS